MGCHGLPSHQAATWAPRKPTLVLREGPPATSRAAAAKLKELQIPGFRARLLCEHGTVLRACSLGDEEHIAGSGYPGAMPHTARNDDALSLP